MRIAVVSDIHGNSAALDAVVADIAAIGADVTVNLGDCLSGPLDAVGTADRLMALGWPTVSGNHDRALHDRAPDRMGLWERWTIGALSPAVLDWLRALPPTREVAGWLLCHAVPGDDATGWLDHADPPGMRPATPEEAEAPARGLPQAGFLCGHTHVPRLVRLSDGRPVVNPGSVGVPAWADRRGAVPLLCETGAPDARYAVLDCPDGPLSARVTLRSVPYDPAPMIALARGRDAPDWVAALATGRIPR
jgi:predicted phosphodiesterase